MNKRGFTLIEIVVTFAILALLFGIGFVVYDSVFDTVSEKYYHTLENDLVLAGNEYYKDHRDELPINGYGVVTVADLIDNHYIEPLKDKSGNECQTGNVYVYYGENSRYEYDVCLKCGDYESIGVYCGNDVVSGNKALIPTDIMCQPKRFATYTGSNQSITIVNETVAYKFNNNVQKNAGKYQVTASLKPGYQWNDNTEGNKTITCELYKATPKIEVSKNSINMPIESETSITEISNVSGKFTNYIDKTEYIEINPEMANVTANNPSEITISSKEYGKTMLMIGFTPDDTANYNTIAYDSGNAKIVNITVLSEAEIPTEEQFCKNNLSYNGESQVLTNDTNGEFVFVNNQGMNAGSYQVAARLVGKRVWTDNTSEDKYIECSIGKAVIPIPELPEDKEYTSIEQSHGIIVSNNVSVDNSKGTKKATDVGNYTVYVNLNDTTNYEWSDGTTAEKSIAWKIVKSNTTTSLSTVSNTYTGSSQAASGASAKLSSNNSTISGALFTYKYYSNSTCTTEISAPTNAGTYYVKATLTGTGNYNSSTSGCMTYTMSKINITIKASDQSESNVASLAADNTCEISSGSLISGQMVTCTECSGSVSLTGEGSKNGTKTCPKEGISITNTNGSVNYTGNYEITTTDGILSLTISCPNDQTWDGSSCVNNKTCYWEYKGESFLSSCTGDYKVGGRTEPPWDASQFAEGTIKTYYTNNQYYRCSNSSRRCDQEKNYDYSCVYSKCFENKLCAQGSYMVVCE